MRALRQLGRSASATLLLGRSRKDGDVEGHRSEDAALMEEQAEEQGEASSHVQTPLDKTLAKIGFGTYQKKLL